MSVPESDGVLIDMEGDCIAKMEIRTGEWMELRQRILHCKIKQRILYRINGLSVALIEKMRLV